MSGTHATYERATLEYDDDHERALLNAITQAIFTASKVSDTNAIIVRTGEATQALLTALSIVLALLPTVTRSPTALRRTIDNLHKRLPGKVAAAEKSADLQDFLRRSFRGNDAGGNA